MNKAATVAIFLMLAVVPLACAGSSDEDAEIEAPVPEEAMMEEPAAAPFEPPEAPARPIRPTIPSLRPTPAISTPLAAVRATRTPVEGVIHLTFVSHNEEPGPGSPDWAADPASYLNNRELVEALARLINQSGAAYNFQSDWNYLLAVEMFDTAEVRQTTRGKNILRWMAEDMGVEIDPHAQETRYNYADVASLIENLGVTPSGTVGGFLFGSAGNPQGWQQYQSGLLGRVFPEYFWQVDILWGAANAFHLQDDEYSGTWRPASHENFYQHDPAGTLIYLGSCTRDFEGVEALIAAIDSGAAPADGFYTAAVTLHQNQLTAEGLARIEAFLLLREDDVRRGRVRWATLSKIARLWTGSYDEKPFQLDCAGL